MPALFRLVMALSVLASCFVQAAEHAYRYLDASGKVIYSQLPPPPGIPIERIDISPAGSGKPKPSGQTRGDDRARHSTASEAVPYREVWRENERKADRATQVPVPVIKPLAPAAKPVCEAGQDAPCGFLAPAK